MCMMIKDKYIDPEKLQQDNVLKQAFEVAEFLAMSKDQQFAYQLDLKARLDYKNVMDYAKEEAKKEGVEQGMKTREIEIAKSLLGILDDHTIALKTGLSMAEIEQLK